MKKPSSNIFIRIDPEYQNAWNNKGATLNDLGRYEEAIEAYDEVIK